MLPGLKVENSKSDMGTSLGIRMSERPKKPSSRWNEETGFVAEPPRSTKKKVLCGESSEAPDGLRSMLDDTISSIRRSLEFLGPQSEEGVDAHATEVAQDGSGE